MEKVTISQLKNSLSAYLRKVRGGEALLILDREEPVARLERIDPTHHPDARLLRLEQAGAIRRAQRERPLDALTNSTPPRPRRSVLEAMLEERRKTR
jgi:antitoxin (DNA-binding transcriptional repressor) of toxin-antitoxin stability system